MLIFYPLSLLNGCQLIYFIQTHRNNINQSRNDSQAMVNTYVYAYKYICKYLYRIQASLLCVKISTAFGNNILKDRRYLCVQKCRYLKCKVNKQM